MTPPNAMPFNFLDLDPFTRDVPYGALAELRRTTPVYWHAIPGVPGPGGGFWLLTRHKDVLHVQKNPAIFSSHQGLTLSDIPGPEAPPAWQMIRDGLTHLDPPEHMAHRQLVAPSFSPRTVAALEGRIRDIAVGVLDSACARGHVDFASDVALSFPVKVVFGVVLGLPPEDFARAVYWSDVIVAPHEPRFHRTAGTRVVEEMYEYAIATLASRRKEPKEDVLSILAHTRKADGSPISEQVFVRYFWSLMTGAFDTTASAISGGMLALMTFPAQYTRLLDDPSVLHTAVEEMLRWETPTIYFRRTATRDTEIDGQAIKQGQRVLMCYAAANRDEAAFTNPDVFDVARKPNDHLSFGHGEHFCLGANLARLEIRILFEEIIRRRLRIVSCGPTRRARSNFQNRLQQMPVSISAVTEHAAGSETTPSEHALRLHFDRR
jgi:cholest-4-en-3-one 26-monooxygenase